MATAAAVARSVQHAAAVLLEAPPLVASAAEGWDALDLQTFPLPNILFVRGAELGVGFLSVPFFGLGMNTFGLMRRSVSFLWMNTFAQDMHAL